MKIAILGGDRRMLRAGQLLESEGFLCPCFAFEKEICGEYGLPWEASLEKAVKKAKAVILPLPCEKNGILNSPLYREKVTLSEILSLLDRNTLVLGGRIPQRGINIIDYSEREEFQLRNAVPTAEGALALAMAESETTIHGANAVIFGYGRIGRYLAGILKAMGANVTVVLRSLKSRAQAENAGINAVGFEETEAPLSRAQIVFNTVPSKVISHKELKAMNPNTPLIDLASLPGGADRQECEHYGIKLISALGLPAKVAPVTAGNIVFKTVLSILWERGITP